MAVPRAVLMVVGGAYTDRFSPRRVMLASNAIRFVVITVLGVVVLAGAAQLWMLYIFALVFGIADAFFFPAQTSIVPALVPGENLGQANAIVQGTAQLTVFIGPAVAGLMIAVLRLELATPSAEGIGVALLLDGAELRRLARDPVAHPRRRGQGRRGAPLGARPDPEGVCSSGTGRRCA